MSWVVYICVLPCLLSLAGSAIIFAKGKKGNTVQNLLASALLTLGIGISYVGFFQFPGHHTMYWADWFICTSSMLSAPLFFLYICHLTDTSTPVSRSLAFLPAIMVSVANLLLYLLMGGPMASSYFQQVTTLGTLGANPPAIYVVKRIFGSYLFRAVLLVPSSIFIAVSFFRVRKYHRDVEDFHANAEEKYFRPDNVIYLAFLTFFLSALLFTILPYSSYRSHYIYIGLMSMIMDISVVLITVYGVRQTYSAADLAKMRVSDPSNGKPVPTRNELMERLSALDHTGFFMNPDITAATLAEKLGVTTERVVELFRRDYSTTFSNYVNERRIREAVSQMRAISLNTPLTQVSSRVGYQTYTAFAKYFEMFMHVTPSEWMHKYR